MRKLLWILVWTISVGLSAQRTQLDLQVLGNRSRIEIPFDFINDFIIVDILLDNWLPLRFLLDTGAENTIIVDKKLTDFLQVSYQREYRVTGADMEREMVAHLAIGVNMQFPNRLLALNRSILVLEENYFHFENITGTEIHGILGADFLMRFAVEIDYRRKRLILHEPNDYRITKKHQQIPATFFRNRPYLDIPIGISSREPVDRRLLMDTGAGLYLLLHSGEEGDLDLPQKVISTTIAHGLGGKVKGNVGRAKSIGIGDQQISDVVTYFQNVDPHLVDSTRLLQREGVLGNSLLSRFNVMIDYVRHKVWLAPTRKWKRKIKFDRSGLLISATGPDLNRFIITGVLPGSPAEEAGLQAGDRIKKINGVGSEFLTLDAILNKMEKKVGKRIKMRIRRKTVPMEFIFYLRDLI